MPVPRSNAPIVTQRRLLRDEVLDRMLAAVRDGTLEPGETLRDDELAAWLGVSRTPIREAISRLVEMGIVEMSPNRYTRIAVPDLETLADKLRLIGGLAELGLRWGVPRLEPEDLKAYQELHRAMRKQAKSRDKGMAETFSLALQVVAAKAGSPTLVRTIDSLLAQVLFLLGPASEHYDYPVMHDFFGQLLETIEAGDGEAAAALMRLATEQTATEFLKAADRSRQAGATDDPGRSGPA